MPSAARRGIQTAQLVHRQVHTVDHRRLVGDVHLQRGQALTTAGFLGLGTDRYPLPWEQIRYDAAQDGYVVDLDKSVLEGAPRYPKLAEPEFTDEYNRKVYEYYSNP